VVAPIGTTISPAARHQVSALLARSWPWPPAVRPGRWRKPTRYSRGRFRLSGTGPARAASPSAVG